MEMGEEGEEGIGLGKGKGVKGWMGRKEKWGMWDWKRERGWRDRTDV